MKKQTISQLVAKRFVAPGLDAIAAIRAGKVAVHDVVNLHMLTRLALRARTRQLTAPKPGILNALVQQLAAGISTGDTVELDPHAITEAEQWIRKLAAQMGRTSTPNLQRLIEDLILIAELRQLNFGSEDSESSIKNLATKNVEE